jgi:hypothetical protein
VRVGGLQKTRAQQGQRVLMFHLMLSRFLMILSILGVPVIAGAQRQATEGASLPQRGSEKYRLMVDAFADRAIHFAYAKRFVQLHERSLTDRQCEQYSQVAVEYRDQWATLRRAGVSA